MGSRLLPSTCQNEAATGSIDPTKADIATLREQYKKVISWENKCIWYDKKQPQSTIYLPCHRWQAIVATHKHLLQEHERFFSRSQMPSASAAIRNVPFNHAMFDRMWRYGIYSPLELLHRNLSETLVHMLDFIDYVSSTLNRFLAFDPALGVVLYEQLGDVTRYRMAIERQDRKHWARITRYWYQKAADRNPNIGRIQHSLAVLSHSDVLQKLFYLTKAFVSVQPYPPGQATIDIFFDHWKNLHFQHDMAAHFVIAHSALLVNDSGDRFKTSANIFMSLLPRHVQRPRSLNQHEVYIMSCNIASILGYGTPEYQHMADHFSKQNSGAATVFAGISLAHNSIIGIPTAGQKLTKGSSVVIQLERPNSLTGSTEIDVVIGISTRASTACPPAGEVMGTILYHGGFDPQYHEASQPPYQNFTVTVPTLITAGNGQINIANVVLVGAATFPYLETLNLAGSHHLTHWDILAETWRPSHSEETELSR
ncbi:unnamed protein product [Penicillium viridicatum]